MLAPLSSLRAVLFDLDGTLIDTHIDFAQMKREVLTIVKSFGVLDEPLKGLDILSVVDAGEEALRSRQAPGDAARLRSVAFARLREIEEAQCAHPVEVDGASDLTLLLRRAGVPVAVVTRNCRAVAEALVARGRLHCDALITRDDVARTKPHPDHVLAALSLLGLGAADSAHTAMVGDHWMDVRAGRAAGCATIGVLRGRQPEAFAPEPPDFLVNSVADLVPVWSLGGVA